MYCVTQNMYINLTNVKYLILKVNFTKATNVTNCTSQFKTQCIE